jgi:uncharacterized damage-inducible protein DinB
MPNRQTRHIPEPLGAILRALDQAYDHSAWHGTNLRGSIRGLSTAQAMWRPAPRRHNIYELVLHAAYWKYAVRRALQGEKRGQFPLKGSNWFAPQVAAGEKEWKQAVALLQEVHTALRAAVATLPAARLHQRMQGSRKWSVIDAILGVAFHDLYHAGQIQLLKRLQKST